MVDFYGKRRLNIPAPLDAMAGTYQKPPLIPSVGFLQISPLMPHPDSYPGGTWRVRTGRPESRKPGNVVFPKNRGNTPKMDGENHGKPYEQMDDLGGKPHYFRKHPCGESLSFDNKPLDQDMGGSSVV